MTASTILKRLQFQNEETEGQALVEYALIIFLIAVACITALATFGDGANGLYGSINSALPFM